MVGKEMGAGMNMFRFASHRPAACGFHWTGTWRRPATVVTPLSKPELNSIADNALAQSMASDLLNGLCVMSDAVCDMSARQQFSLSFRFSTVTGKSGLGFRGVNRE